MTVTVSSDQFLFTEKYRPATISECILPPRIKNFAKQLVESGEITNMMFHGGAGSGKTTLAKAICNELGCDSIIINGSEENGIDTLRTKMMQFATSVSLNGMPKVIIIDEAEYLNANSVQPALRNFIEGHSKNCRFIFTCNFKNKLIAPLHSRLTPVDFTLSKDEKMSVVTQFFKRVCEILTMESISFEKPVVAKIIERHFPDFRRILGELQKFSLQAGGTIDADVLAAVKDVEIKDLIDAFKGKDFKKMRQWIVSNSDTETSAIIRRLFDSLQDVCVPSCIPNVILLLADYSYKSSFVVDQELNLTACFTELMAHGEWK